MCAPPELLELGRYEIFLNIVVKSTLPCVFVLVLNIVTIIRIRRSLSFRQQFTGDTIPKAEKEIEDKVTLPLLLVSGFAFVTLLPQTFTEVVDILPDMFQADEAAVTLARDIFPIFNAIYLLNFALNFYILIVSWPEYRMIIKRHVCHVKSPKNPKFSRQTSSLKSSSMKLSETSISNIAVRVSTDVTNTTLRSPSVQDSE